MVQVKSPVLVHRPIARDHYRMRLKAPAIARRAVAGQFIHLSCADSFTTHPLLKRPFSLLDVDPAAGTIDFIYKVVGKGTAALAEAPVGSSLDLLGPLGRPFTIPPRLKQAYLVGGGVGIPPLYLLAKKLLRQRVQVKAFLGARTKEWVICAEMFHKRGAEVQIATDDGTLGHRGSVVDLLQESVSSTGSLQPSTCLYICGPTLMMAAAAAVACRRRLQAQVSLEERMGCAMGCCMGCVVEVTTEPADSHARFQRVCTEGPVFSAEEIAWTSN